MTCPSLAIGMLSLSDLIYGYGNMVWLEWIYSNYTNPMPATSMVEVLKRYKKLSVQVTDFRVKLDRSSSRFELSADTLFARNSHGNSL